MVFALSHYGPILRDLAVGVNRPFVPVFCPLWPNAEERLAGIWRAKPGSSLFLMKGLLGLPEGSRAKRCLGSGPLPASRVSADHPNPAWHPKPSSRWPPVPPTLHPTLPRPAPEPHRSTLDPDRGYYGEAQMGLPRYERAVGDASPPIPPNQRRTPVWLVSVV